MKKLTALFTMLVAALLFSASPAFSGSGPYGSYGLSGNIDTGQGVKTPHDMVTGGSGPYGAFGPTFKGLDTPRTAVVGGSGPYGALDSYGLIGWGTSNMIVNKNECLLLAKNCPKDLTK